MAEVANSCPLSLGKGFLLSPPTLYTHLASYSAHQGCFLSQVTDGTTVTGMFSLPARGVRVRERSHGPLPALSPNTAASCYIPPASGSGSQVLRVQALGSIRSVSRPSLSRGCAPCPTRPQEQGQRGRDSCKSGNFYFPSWGIWSFRTPDQTSSTREEQRRVGLGKNPLGAGAVV